MDTVERTAAPWHLWTVGIVSLLWNAMGAADYTMTHLVGAEYLRQGGFDDTVIAYFDTLPAWATASWALGVWGAVAGSVLLLMRSRYAVWAFALSLLGVLLTTANSFVNPYPASMVSTGGMVFEWTIKLVAALLLWYAWAMQKRGVLR
jgi:hypothetical protein